MTLEEIVGSNIAWLRQRRGLSQQRLAERCGLSIKSIEEIESAKRGITADEFFAIARAIACSPTALLLGENPTTLNKTLYARTNRKQAWPAGREHRSGRGGCSHLEARHGDGRQKGINKC